MDEFVIQSLVHFHHLRRRTDISGQFLVFADRNAGFLNARSRPARVELAQIPLRPRKNLPIPPKIQVEPLQGHSPPGGWRGAEPSPMLKFGFLWHIIERRCYPEREFLSFQASRLVY
jgi:hypothetical protein